ncbi:MAG: sarcosine oxidase subunit delta [Pseudomonadota bacterium]
MLIVTCPCCGIKADETELHPGGQAHIARAGPGDDDAAMQAYLFERKNPKGVHFERWRHVYGCGKWFHAARCTVTNEVFGTYPAQTLRPPNDLIKKIKSRRPGWSMEGAA